MNTQKTPSQPEQPKKIYISPALQVYGTLAQVTANISSGTRASDNGNNKNTHG